jgi:enoyl-CoA hydratase
MNLVKTDLRDRVAVVTLDDPTRRNAMSLAMAEEMTTTFRDLESSPDVGAVVLTGTPPAFSAGADLDDLEQATRESLLRIYEGFLVVARSTRPTIAAVNGPAVGAGLNLALACDVRVAARNARFESRFLDLALHPGGGHTWMLQQLLGPQGSAAVVLCGESIDGDEAVRRGLAWTSVDDESVLAEALRLATRAAAAPNEMVRTLKATLRAMAAVTDHDDAVKRELEPQLWSIDQPAFRERIEALKRRITKRKQSE